MQLTLLNAVKDVLDRTDGFYVDSINDTDEALQIAHLAENVYEMFVQKYTTVQWTSQVGTLDNIGDATKPNYLLLPSDLQKLQESKLQYNISDGTQDTVNYYSLKYVTPLEFLNLNKAYRDNDEDRYEVITDFSGTQFVVDFDKQPEYFTSFDGVYIVTDSYKQSIDDTLVASKARVFYTAEAVFLQEDNFVIPIPSHISGLFKDALNAEYRRELRQEPDGLLERRVRAGLVKLQQDNNRVGSAGRPSKSYGRKGARADQRRGTTWQS